jgi:dimethylhistidine N-methyltransferase
MDTQSQLAVDVRRGLIRTPRSLPPHIFYDAAGTRLFEEICELPEYYVTRSEREIFQRYAAEVATQMAPVDHVIELGAGSASKTGLLLAHLASRQPSLTFHPVDVSGEALMLARASLWKLIPTLKVRPFEGLYGDAIRTLSRLQGRKVVLFIGSSLGTFEPATAAQFLRDVRAGLNAGDALLLGTDLPKDRSLLIPAYDDRQGVTAAFNRNALTRINRELGGTFDLRKFRHVALWNEAESRVEMHLESESKQEVRIDALGLRIPLERHERIHTENSYKFSPEAVRQLLAQAGFSVESVWRDGHGWFADWLARAS